MAFPFFSAKGGSASGGNKDNQNQPKKTSKKEEVLELRTSETDVPKSNEKNEEVPAIQELHTSEAGGHKRFSVQEHKLLIRPVVTEKALIENQKGTYLFEVAPNATKLSIKKAIANVYGTMPVAVNMLRRKGKEVRFGKIKGKRKDEKRAIVTLKKGQRIEL